MLLLISLIILVSRCRIFQAIFPATCRKNSLKNPATRLVQSGEPSGEPFFEKFGEKIKKKIKITRKLKKCHKRPAKPGWRRAKRAARFVDEAFCGAFSIFWLFFFLILFTEFFEKGAPKKGIRPRSTQPPLFRPCPTQT